MLFKRAIWMSHHLWRHLKDIQMGHGGTQCSGGLAAHGWWLDSRTSKVFSHLKDSMIIQTFPAVPQSSGVYIWPHYTWVFRHGCIGVMQGCAASSWEISPDRGRSEPSSVGGWAWAIYLLLVQRASSSCQDVCWTELAMLASLEVVHLLCKG